MNASERITPYQALQAMTVHAAWQLGQEKFTGSISPGKNADFVLLSENPLQVSPDAIADIEIQETWIDGQRVNTGLVTPGQLQLLYQALF